MKALREHTGENLHAFSARVLGPGQAEYKWLRKVLSEGAPQKRAGTKNHDRLVRLHTALALEWPALWKTIEPASLLERTIACLSSESAIQFQQELEELVGRFETAEKALRLISQLANDHPEIYANLLAEHGQDQIKKLVEIAIAGQSNVSVNELAGKLQRAPKTEIQSSSINFQLKEEAEQLLLTLSIEFPGQYEQLVKTIGLEKAIRGICKKLPIHGFKVYYPELVWYLSTKQDDTASAAPSNEPTVQKWDQIVAVTVRAGQMNGSESGKNWWDEYCQQFANSEAACESVCKAWRKFSDSMSPAHFLTFFWKTIRVS